MFRNFLKKISGKITMEQIETERSQFVGDTKHGAEIAQGFAPERHSSSNLGRSEWWSQAEPLFKLVADGDSKKFQFLALRGIIIRMVEDMYAAAVLLQTENPIDDIQLMMATIDNPDASIEEIVSSASEQYARCDLTVRFARHLSDKFFDDAGEDDFFKLLASLAQQSADQNYRSTVASQKGEFNPFKSLLPTIKKTFEDVKTRVRLGGNYDSTDMHDADGGGGSA